MRTVQDIGENTFAAACYNDNSLLELYVALAMQPDETDMKTWELAQDEYRDQIQLALEIRKQERKVEIAEEYNELHKTPTMEWNPLTIYEKLSGGVYGVVENETDATFVPTGSNEIEISRFETKTGNPVIFCWDNDPDTLDQIYGETYLMNPKTGSVDSEENWFSEGYGQEHDALVPVVRNSNGEWIEEEKLNESHRH